MKNPIHYKKSNANKLKISFAKRKGILSLLGLFAIIAMFAILTPHATSKGLFIDFGVALSILFPFSIGVRGTKAANGFEETEENFLLRKGKAESDESFVKRSMQYMLDEAIEKANENWKTKYEELSKKLSDIKPGEDLTALKEEMKLHGLAIESLKEIKVGDDRGIKKGSIAETLKIHSEQIKQFVQGKSARALEIEHKTGQQTNTSTDITSRDYMEQWHEGGMVGQIPVRKPFIRELFKNQNTSNEYIRYTDQNTVVRNAKNVALCATSTTNTKGTWITRAIQISKVRDFIDICSDMMSDYLFVQGEIQNLLSSSVKLKIDDQLLVGNGTHPELNSLTTASSTWAPNIAGTSDFTSTIANPNLINLIAVARSQVQQLGQMNAWMPNYVFVNPGDYELMMHLKNSFGDAVKAYPGMYIDNGGTIFINGMMVIANPNVAANTFWIGDFTKGTVYARPGIGIEFSYENATNFETETVTVKAYERLNLLIRNVDKNAFMYCADINAALALIAKP